MTNATQVLHPTPAQHHRFHFLDALRGLAAIVVVFWHMPHAFQPRIPFYGGALSVDFFFCLSGFVIAFSYGQRLLGNMTTKDFLVARWIRLYPTYLLGLFLGAVSLVFIAHIHFGIVNLVLALMMLPDSHGKANAFVINTPAWSLFYEVLANIAFVLLIKRGLGGVRIAAGIAIGAFLYLLVRIHMGSSMNSGATFRTADIGFARLALSFWAGVVVHHLFVTTTTPGRRPKLSGFAAAVIVVLLLALLVSPAVWMGNGFAQAAFVALVFPTLVYAGSFVPTTSVWTTVCTALGEISFPLYMIHTFYTRILFTERATSVLAAHPSIRHWNLLALAALLWISYRVARDFDAPIRKYLVQRYRSRNAVPILGAEIQRT